MSFCPVFKLSYINKWISNQKTFCRGIKYLHSKGSHLFGSLSVLNVKTERAPSSSSSSSSIFFFFWFEKILLPNWDLGFPVCLEYEHLHLSLVSFSPESLILLINISYLV